MSIESYQNLINEKKFNFYEGFSDTLSELVIKEIDETNFEILDKTDFFCKNQTILDTEGNIVNDPQNLDNVLEPVIDANPILNSDLNLPSEKIENTIEPNPIIKKTKKKRNNKRKANPEKVDTQVIVSENDRGESLEVTKNKESLKNTNNRTISEDKTIKIKVKGRTRKDKKLKEIDSLLENDAEDDRKNRNLISTASNNNKFYFVNFFNGVYYGELKHAKMNGVGKFKYNSGSILRYVGEFQENLKHGQGKEFYANGGWYFGQFENDERSGEGEGLVFYSETSYYKGQLLNNMKHGKGEFVTNNGTKYVGLWDEDTMDCENGIWTCFNGSKYNGGWKRHKFHGYGEYVGQDGNKYNGMFELNKRHGEGEFYMTNGDVYKGEFLHNKFNGQGILENNKESKIIEGTWVDGLLNGIVTVKTEDYKMKGNYKNNVPNGYIEKKFKKFDGYYKGMMINGMKSGLGEIKFENGDTYKGLWDTDMFNGKGEMRYSNGSRYKGFWKNDKRHGQGEFTDKVTENFYKCNWNYGLKDGSGEW